MHGYSLEYSAIKIAASIRPFVETPTNSRPVLMTAGKRVQVERQTFTTSCLETPRFASIPALLRNDIANRTI